MYVIVFYKLIIRWGMYYCCASVSGRGIHYTLRAVRKWLKQDCKHTKYYMKIEFLDLAIFPQL